MSHADQRLRALMRSDDPADRARWSRAKTRLLEFTVNDCTQSPLSPKQVREEAAETGLCPNAQLCGGERYWSSSWRDKCPCCLGCFDELKLHGNAGRPARNCTFCGQGDWQERRP